MTDNLFTATNIVGVGVATTAVTVVSNALYKLAKLPARWTAFVASAVIAYAVIGMQSAPQWFDWLLGFFNACLLYCSALGMNEAGAAALAPAGRGFAATEGFFVPWLGRSGGGAKAVPAPNRGP
jgi:hypothetical protein